MEKVYDDNEYNPTDRTLLNDLRKMLTEVLANITSSPKVYTISDVAEILKCKERAVKHHLHEAHDLRYLKIGREVRIKEEDLQEFLENRTASCIYDQEVLP
jgi:excisionase family DNA binding protein